MIAAEEFARVYSSFWTRVAPFSESYVRYLNEHLGSSEQTLQMATHPQRRALIAEIAYELLRSYSTPAGAQVNSLSDSEREALFLGAQLRVGGLPGLRGADLSAPNAAEWADVIELADRVVELLSLGQPSGPVIIGPIFPGCGVVDEAEGDVLVGMTLYEIKAVERPFRSSDIQQLLVYAALAHAAGETPPIGRMGLVNPRSMKAVAMAGDELSLAISGHPLPELLDVIVDAMSAPEASP